MRRLVLVLLVVAAMMFCCYVPARAETRELAETVKDAAAPALSLGDVLKEAAEWIVTHGEVAYLYDCIGDERGGETIAKLTLVELFDVVNVDAAVVLPLTDVLQDGDLESLGDAPALAGGLGTTLRQVLEKFDVEWDVKFDITLGGLTGYDFDKKDWIVGPVIGIRGTF